MNDQAVIIERMQPKHLPEVLRIEQASYPDPWSQAAFMREIETTGITVAIVAQRAGVVLGYVVAWFIVDEAHIGNVTVAPEYRRQGTGRLMMEWLLRYAVERGCTFSTLEVRASNRGAQRLYESLGFRSAALRKAYYSHPPEDAIVMLRTL
jgi:ribosomal-protein-alanine N-acetyltransferase